MRLRFARDRKTQRRLLLLRTQGAEAIDPRMQRWLEEHGGTTPICGVARVVRGRRSAEVRLDVEGLTSLRGYLRHVAIDTCAMLQMLQDLVEAISLCVNGGFRYDALLYDARYVFVDGNGRLWFVLAPFCGTSFVAANSPLALLQVMGDAKRLRVRDVNAAALCERMGRYAESQAGVFSLNRLRAFVRAETSSSPVGSEDTRIGASSKSCDAKDGFVLRDMSTGTRYPLLGDMANRVGRGEMCEVRVKGHSALSRVHASVCVRNRRVVVHDLGSTNGTYVQGVRVMPQTEVEVGMGEEFFLSNDPFCVERA